MWPSGKVDSQIHEWLKKQIPQEISCFLFFVWSRLCNRTSSQFIKGKQNSNGNCRPISFIPNFWTTISTFHSQRLSLAMGTLYLDPGQGLSAVDFGGLPGARPTGQSWSAATRITTRFRGAPSVDFVQHVCSVGLVLHHDLVSGKKNLL